MYEYVVQKETVLDQRIIQKQCDDYAELGYRLVSTAATNGVILLFFEKHLG